jgi:hypothetical protein
LQGHFCLALLAVIDSARQIYKILFDDYVKFEVFLVVSDLVFWDAVRYNVDRCQDFRGTCSSLQICSAMKKEVVGTSRILALTLQNTEHWHPSTKLHSITSHKTSLHIYDTLS